MSTVAEIESAICHLPPPDVKEVAVWLQQYVRQMDSRPDAPGGDAFAKWRGRGRLPAGESVDDYIRLIRDADSR